MPIETPKQVALKWVAAYNSHNADEAAALYDVNVTNVQMPYKQKGSVTNEYHYHLSMNIYERISVSGPYQNKVSSGEVLFYGPTLIQPQ